MTDSMPIATGFSRGSLSFRLISQATSQPWARTERILLDEQHLRRRCFRLAVQQECVRAEELGVVRRGAFHGESATGESGVFAQLQSS